MPLTDPATITALSTAAGGLLLAMSQFNSKKSDKTKLENKLLRARTLKLEEQVVDLAADRYEITKILAANGLRDKIPSMPKSLEKPIDEEVSNG